MFKRYAILLFLACGLPVLCAQGAQADSPAPGWEMNGYSVPTNLPPGGEGTIEIQVFNVGAAASVGNATLTDRLPAGMTATGGCPETTPGTVTCTIGPEPVSPRPFAVGIDVHVAADAEGVHEPVDQVEISGGGALGMARTSFPVHYSSKPAGLGFGSFDTWATNADGTTDTQAGSHPYEFTVVEQLNNELFDGEFRRPAGGEQRNVIANLPPGLIGDPSAVPQCTRAEFDSFESKECPRDTIIGEDTFYSGGLGLAEPLYNLVPPAGVAAQFGFSHNAQPVIFDAGVRTGGDNGITEHVYNIPRLTVTYNVVTVWGIPGEHAVGGESIEEREARVGLKPFLTFPTACDGPQEFSIEMQGTWNDETTKIGDSSIMHNEEDVPTGLTGCERLVHFEPTVSIQPETSYSDTPTGFAVNLKVPQGVNPEGLATSNIQDTTVTLPEGVVVNPGQATGLVACQPSEEAFGTEPDGEVKEGPASCPEASKVGTDEISTPLLPKKLEGNVYILGQDPPNLQLLVTASGEGVNIKLVGTVHLNETTGQLTTTFEKTPDMPFTDFKLTFSGGAQAALATPTVCGTYGSTSDFTPWSSPFVEAAFDTSSFQITNGPGDDGVADCTGPLPFTPAMTAGATTDQAAGYTDFTMLLSRGDGQQRIEKLQFKTPEGLLGMIAKVPLCGEPQAAQGTCSAASRIGHTVAEVGPGPYPFVLPEPGAPPAPIYLTGPYEGAPFGLSIAVPIVAGPFNLGTEVVRAKIEVDPHTSQLTISTTAFPKTVKGIPTDIREIDAVIDRPEFMFNPTSCNAMSFSGTAYSFEGATAPVSSHFQMGSCRSLAFKPNFSVSTSGKTSRANGASLTAKIVYPTGNLGANQASSQSNIASVKVDLPKQLPSRLTTLQKACTAATFEANPANCPAASIVGHAKAITPVLPVPIEGPTYFVSHAGEEFPSLIAVLQGYGVTVDLVGSTFINNKTNITSSTFKNVPDVPIASFELGLPQGKYSALAGEREPL